MWREAPESSIQALTSLSTSSDVSRISSSISSTAIYPASLLSSSSDSSATRAVLLLLSLDFKELAVLVEAGLTFRDEFELG